MKTAFFTVTAIAFCLTSVLPAFAKDFDAPGKNFHPDEISADITVENQKDTDQKQPQKSAEKQLKGQDKKQKTAVLLKSEPQQTKNSEPALPETNNKTVKTQTVDVASDEQEIDANSGRSGDVENPGNNSGSDNGSGSDKNSGSDNSSGTELWAYIIFGIIGILLIAIGVALYLMVKPGKDARKDEKNKQVTLPGGRNSANNVNEKPQFSPPPVPHSQQSTANNFTPYQQNISSPATSVNSAKERDLEIKISGLNSEITRLEQEKQGLEDENATLTTQVSDLSNTINELNLEKQGLVDEKATLATQVSDLNSRINNLEQVNANTAAELEQAKERAAAELEQAKEKAENEKTELKNEYEGKLTTLEEEKKAEVSAAEQKLIDAFPEKTGVFRKWLESTFGNISALHKVMIYSLARLELLSKEENKRPAFDELVRLDDALWAYFGENCTDEYESLNTLRNQLEPICNEILASTEYKIQWTPKGTDVNGDDNYRIVDDSGCVVVVTVKAMIYKGEVVVQKSKVICSAVE
ncbi:MAG: hypothetical protein IJW08_10360 [Lentisphaeria bacterium]|nr:hypothetical protein [Lentisphaeria bacterium]MBQ7396929.1 hypothetical protein [Lentisphaeria bacterium]